MMQNWKQKIRPKVLHSPHIKNTQIPRQTIHIWTFCQKKKKSNPNQNKATVYEHTNISKT